MKRKFVKLLSAFLIAASVAGCANVEIQISTKPESVQSDTRKPTEGLTEATYAHAVKSHNGSETIPAYAGQQVIELNNGVPYFTKKDLTTKAFESYSDLDALGRCGVAYANVCNETLPNEKRGEIGNVRPSGWDFDGKSNNHKYAWVDGNYVFNRCHLLAYMATAENDTVENLITGTRAMNLAMIPYEDEVVQYVKKTGNHVLYRVTPIFYKKELVAQGVEMEALSVEDNGAGVRFHTFIYNAEPGVVINYATGENHSADGSVNPAIEGYESALGNYRDKNGNLISEAKPGKDQVMDFVVNTGTMKAHLPDCEFAAKISEKNRHELRSNMKDLLADGYTTCKSCIGQQ